MARPFVAAPDCKAHCGHGDMWRDSMTTSNETDSIVNTGDEAAFTDDQLAQMFNAGMNGDTKAPSSEGVAEEEGAKPGAPTESGEAAKEPEGGAPEEKTDPDPANTVILAKDGKHTIDFSHLEKAREQRDSYKAKAEDAEARAEDAKRQLAELQEQAQARADAGKPPTPQDQLVQKAQEAIDKGVDPSIFGDYGEEDLAKGFYELNRRSSEQMRAEVKAELMQELRAEIAPLLQRQQQDAASAHMNAILQVHPDISSVLESTEFAGWVGKQPSYVQAAMSAVLDKGSSAQIVELLDSYKAATTQQSQKTSQTTTPHAAAQKVLEQLKPSVPNSPSDIPGGRSGAGTLAERLQSMSEVDVFNAVNSGDISEEQLNRYLSRKS